MLVVSTIDNDDDFRHSGMTFNQAVEAASPELSAIEEEDLVQMKSSPIAADATSPIEEQPNLVLDLQIAKFRSVVWSKRM